MKREYPEAPIVSVGVVVAKDDRVLMVKRGKEPGYGQWSIPGGAVELGETLQKAAAREVREECGLTVRIDLAIEVLDRIMLDSRHRVRYHYVIVDYLGWYIAGDLHISDELIDAQWILEKELSHFEMTDIAREVFRKAFHAIEARSRNERGSSTSSS